MLRKDGRLPFLRPDAKSQVTMRYVDGKPHSIDTVVLSTHSPDQKRISDQAQTQFLRGGDRGDHQAGAAEGMAAEHALSGPARPAASSWRPAGDCGLTGRKIIVDTYGGACPAVAARSQARTRQGGPLGCVRRALRRQERRRGRLAKQCQVRVAYAIGVAKPMATVVYRGTGVIPDEENRRTGE